LFINPNPLISRNTAKPVRGLGLINKTSQFSTNKIGVYIELRETVTVNDNVFNKTGCKN